jgi:hypothetical protein
VNWYGIAALKALGLAWDIKLPKPHPVSEPARPVETPKLAPEPLVEEEALVPTSAGD